MYLCIETAKPNSEVQIDIDFTQITDAELFEAHIKEVFATADIQETDFIIIMSEDIPSQFLTTDSIDDEFWEYLDDVDGLNEDACAAYVAWTGSWDKQGFENHYQGEYGDDESFVKSVIEDMSDVPSWVVIDYEATASGLMQDYHEEDGYYFRA